MSACTRNTNPVLLKLRYSALGRDDRLLPGFSRKLGPVCLTHIGRLLSRGQFGAGLLGVGFQQLIDFFAAIHGDWLGLDGVDDISLNDALRPPLSSIR